MLALCLPPFSQKAREGWGTLCTAGASEIKPRRLDHPLHTALETALCRMCGEIEKVIPQSCPHRSTFPYAIFASLATDEQFQD